VDYLLELHDTAAARVELLIAAGNAPPNLHLNALFADKLLETGDTADALDYYGKAIADNPRDAAALAAAGRIVYRQGDYAKAHALLARAVENEPAASAGREELETLARDAGRLVELSLSRELAAHTRSEHLLAAAKIASTRLASCSAQISATIGAPVFGAVADLQTRWKAASPGAKRDALAENAAGQDMLTQLIFDTERETAEVCGQPSGDDELLLKLAEDGTASNQASGRAPQPAPQPAPQLGPKLGPKLGLAQP
jgi:tetratricopeptide (TPR) repeat protein